MMNYLKKIRKYNIYEILVLFLIFLTFMGSNFIKFSIFNINFNVGRIVMVILAFVSLYNLLIKRDLKKIILNKDKDMRYVLLFFIGWSLYSMLSIYKVKDFNFYLITNFFVCVGTLNILFFYNKVNIIKILNLFFKIVITTVTINCIFYFAIYIITNLKIGGFYHNSNDLATVLLLSIPCLIYLLFITKNKVKIFLQIGALIINLLTFFSINSRGCFLGIISAIIFFLIYLFIKEKEKILKNTKLKILLFLCVIIIISFGTWFFVRYIGKINFKPIENAERSNDVRINLIYNGIEFLKEDANFIVGIGAGNSIYYLKNYSKYSVHGIYNFHNFWLDLIVSYGVLVTIGFCIMYVIIIKKFLKKSLLNSFNNIYNIFLFFLLSFIIASISSSTIITREWIWVLLSVIISVIKNNEENKL